ncbi:MAG: Internalin-A precursor [Firmicutes bacterium ADurb.Bin419]|nr:MAG: Internalin-A precursor [Firmicutes bacterium ADurb.Bin419]
MKKVLSIIVILVVLLSAQFVGYSEEAAVQVVIDGQVLEIEPGAQIIGGSTYVPLKTFVNSDAYEAEVQEISGIQSREYIINYKKIGRVIKLSVSQGIINEITINGIIKKTNVKTIFQQEQIWVPIVFLVEYLGGQATWNELAHRVIVESYKPVLFRDMYLNEVVRSYIGNPEGDIFKCDLEPINTLVIPNKNITDLDGIQSLSNLNYLDLSNNKIKDVTPLRELTKLNILYLKGNQISDYSPLAAIYNQLNLRDFNMEFGIYDRNIESEIRAKAGKPSGKLSLEDMQVVTELDLSNKGIVDLQGIQYLTNLRELDLTGNNIKFIDNLKNLTSLQELSLNQNSIENIQALSYLKNLEQLDLFSNQISDLSPLAELVKLKQLSVMENKISDVSMLKNLLNLEILVLQNNEISDISSLGNLVNLKELYLGQNKIEDISMMGTLSGLEILMLKDNKISDITGLKDLHELQELYLNGNPVTDYSVLANAGIVLKKSDFEAPTIIPDITGGPQTMPTPDSESGPEVVLRFYIEKPFYYLNNKKTNMDVVPIIKGGRTFLPVKYVAESLGANVEWEPVERKITVTLGKDILEMVLDKEMAYVNGQEKKIDVPPFVENGRTLVPLRFLSETFGCTVDWDPDLRCATFYSKAYVAKHPEVLGEPAIETETQEVVPTPANVIVPIPTDDNLPASVNDVLPTPVSDILPTPTNNILPTQTNNIIPTPTNNVLPTPARDILPATVEDILDQVFAQ